MKSYLVLAGLLLGMIHPYKSLPQAISGSAIKNVVRQSARLLEQHYVFPAEGKRIALDFLKAEKGGEFDTCSTWTAFAKKATVVLRASGHDGHLYVAVDPATVSQLKSDTAQHENAPSPFYYGPQAAEKNYGFSAVEILPGNIGYIHLSEINLSGKSIATLKAAMTFIKNTRALIVDLRNNGGGGSDIGAVLEGYFIPHGNPLLEVRTSTGKDTVMRSQTVDTAHFYERPLYILVNKKTASAAEAFAFIMQQQKRAGIVGQTTAGAAHMNDWYPLNDTVYLSVSTAAPVLPGTTRSWEQKGIEPDHRASPGKELEAACELLK